MTGFRFDFISFLIGFLAATVLAFVVYRLRNRISRVRQQATERAERARRFATRTADARYTLDLVNYCQRYHLARQLVELKDIVVEPRFIRAIKPYDDSIESRRDVFRVIPMIHEFPVCYAPYNIETLGISDLGAGERRLALLGLQGSGRSTALAAIALWAMGEIEFTEAEDLVQQAIDEEEAQLDDKERLARQKEREEIQARALEQIKKAQEEAAEALGRETGVEQQRAIVDLRRLMPILVHLADVVVDVEAQDAQVDPAEPLVRAIQHNVRSLTAMTMPRYVYNRLNSGQALVLLDGLDDLPPAEQQRKLAWLREFLACYTECTVIVTGPATGYHPLLQLGLTPVFLRPWTDVDARLYVEKWTEAWPRAAAKGRRLAELPDEKVIQRVAANTRGLTVLDLTMRLLAAYAADEKQQGRWGWYDAFVLRKFEMKAIEADDSLIDDALNTMAATAAEGLISGPITLTRLTEIATEALRRTDGTGSRRETFALDVSGFVSTLTGESGLMVRRCGDVYEFCHPLVTAFLASDTLLNPESEFTLEQAAVEPVWQNAISFAAAHAQTEVMNQAVRQKLAQTPDLLFNNLFDLVRWMPDAPANAAWRGEVFKRLAAALIGPSQFPTLREWALAALLATLDKNILFILRQALRSMDTHVRRLACIGLGVLGEGEALKDLRPMLEDDDLDVQLAAGLALGAIGSERALEIMIEGLIAGDENLRQAVAEALAAIPGQGHQVLYEAIGAEDMMVRRAAIFGLARVGTPWALTGMYRALLEDEQWYVRSAAEQAFAEAQDLTQDAATAHPPVETLEWLVDWAAQQGEGVPSGENAKPMLVRALQEGAPEDRIASARTLGLIGYSPALKSLYHALRDNNELVRVAAYTALTDLQAQIGQPLPGVW